MICYCVHVERFEIEAVREGQFARFRGRLTTGIDGPIIGPLSAKDGKSFASTGTPSAREMEDLDARRYGPAS